MKTIKPTSESCPCVIKLNDFNFIFIIMYIADQTIAALVYLSYLLPDVRTTPNHEKILYFTEVKIFCHHVGILHPYYRVQ